MNSRGRKYAELVIRKARIAFYGARFAFRPLPSRPQVHSDAWAKKLVDGHLYGAYPFSKVENIFTETLAELGANFPYPLCLNESLHASDAKHASYRNRFMTAFNLFVEKPC